MQSRLARARAGLAAEIGPLGRLAAPVVAAELGWVAMWIVDTVLVGRLGAEAIGAVSLGGQVFYTIALFGMGMLLGLDYLVSHAAGGGRMADAHRALVQGMWVGVLLAVVLTPLAWLVAVPLLRFAGVADGVLVQTGPYVDALMWSLLPLLLFTALRRYLQALGLVAPIVISLVTANVVNAVAAWALIFGRLGAPALGAEGAGWATCAARVYMLAVLVWYVGRHDRRSGEGLRRTRIAPDWARMRRIAALGLPAATQLVLEVGVFAVAAVLAGKIGADSIAAHQLALSAAATSFMVPLGISSAAAVRVGQALGRGDPEAARRAGWTSLVVGGAFMLCAALAFVLAPELILRAFTTDQVVIATGVSLLLIAAVFQLFDGLQVVAAGAMRGTGDTRTPMLANLLAHWGIGLPVAWVLAFRVGLGVIGLWIGLSVGLIVVALTLVAAWGRRIERLAAPDAPPAHAPASAAASAS